MNVSSRCWSPFYANERVFSRNEQQKVYNALYKNIANSENVAPTIFFFVRPSSNVELFINEPNPSVKYKKKIDFESIKSDISNLDRTIN